MENNRSDFENEVKFWLEAVLKNENLKNLSVKILGNSEKGDGYMGDIVFVSASGLTEDGSEKTYELVLKCSKNSQILRDTHPVKDAFLAEIFIYEVVLPYFEKFQSEKGIEDTFNSVPNCYGSFIGKNKEVIVFENLKSMGYDLWPKKDPLTRNHIDLIVREYSKFHATSLAVQHQRPNQFQDFTDDLVDIMKKFLESGDTDSFFGGPIDEAYEMLKNDLDQDTLAKWKNLKRKIAFIFGDMTKQQNILKVILHGDSWNNNFMFLHDKKEKKVSLKVKFLDWQISRYDSPILDLSYFLFSCVSSEDLNDLNDILKTYHESFMQHLGRLGIEDPELLYPRDQFFDDWKNYSKYGVVMTSLLMKIVSTEKDEVVDMAQLAESGRPVSETFSNEIRDKENYKKRIRPIIEYTVKHDLI